MQRFDPGQVCKAVLMSFMFQIQKYSEAFFYSYRQKALAAVFAS